MSRVTELLESYEFWDDAARAKRRELDRQRDRRTSVKVSYSGEPRGKPQTLAEYMAERDSEKYLSAMENLAEDFRAGRSSVSYPEIIMDDGDAKNFYGAVCSGIKKATGKTDQSSIESLGQLSLDIKRVISSNAKRDWRDNVIVHRNMKKELDDLLFDYIEDNNLSWSLDAIDIIIDEILMVAKRVY